MKRPSCLEVISDRSPEAAARRAADSLLTEHLQRRKNACSALLTSGQEGPECTPYVRSWSQIGQKADPKFRINPLTCVGTAGFEPATP
jgi:hypothetical protein